MTTWTFTTTCPCGETIHVVEGQKRAHECRPITAQQVRNAWGEGYQWATAHTFTPTCAGHHGIGEPCPEPAP